MSKPRSYGKIQIWLIRLIPLGIAIAGIAAVSYLVISVRPPQMEPRLPGADNAPVRDESAEQIEITGTFEKGTAEPSELPGRWPWFRGSGHDAIAADGDVKLLDKWSQNGPEVLWSMDVGEGYAGVAVLNGMGYMIDYDREEQLDVVRCFSLENGEDIWRYSYPVKIKRNHGMSRTVPAVTDEYVVAMGPKCHVTCLDSRTGEFKWMLNLPVEYGTTVPPWYAGQCPFIEQGRVILAPAGPEVMMMAVDCESGEIAWECANTMGWTMTHSSIIPMEIGGQRMYLYCASGGILGVGAENGELLWQSDEWRIRIANIPTPVPVDGQRIFLSGGYNRGSVMMKVQPENGALKPEVLYSLEPETFGSDQQTPIYYEGHIYGVRPDGQLVCMDTRGNILWASGSQNKFGLGPYMIVNDRIYVMNDSGLLSMVRAGSGAFELLDQAKVLDGHDSWGPMTYFAGRLIVRDLVTMKCIQIGD